MTFTSMGKSLRLDLLQKNVGKQDSNVLTT